MFFSLNTDVYTSIFILSTTDNGSLALLYARTRCLNLVLIDQLSCTSTLEPLIKQLLACISQYKTNFIIHLKSSWSTHYINYCTAKNLCCN